MKKIFALALLSVCFFTATSQNLREWSSKGTANTLRGVWKYDSSKSYTIGDSLRLVFWKQLVDTAAAIRAAITGGTSYTFSTGLTNTATVITNNVLTGVSGGQTWNGGTASGEDIVINSTTHSTKGHVLINTSASTDIRFDLNGGVPRIGGNPRLQFEGFGSTGIHSEFKNETTFTGDAILDINTTSAIAGTSSMLRVRATSNNVALSVRGDSRILFNTTTPATEIFYFNGKARFDSVLTLNRLWGTTPINILGRLADSTLTSITNIPVTLGGTGIATTTAYGLLAGGTTATGAFQNAGTGTAGQVYVSNGSASLGTWQALEEVETAEVNTSSTTQTTLATISPVTGERGMLLITLSSVVTTTGNDGTNGYKIVRYKRNGSGTLSIIGTTDVVATESDNASTWTIDVSGTDLRVRVTSGTTDPTVWNCTIVKQLSLSAL